MYNEFGIGICLVGNFNATRPTAAQMRSLSQLTGYLMRAYRIAPDHVIGHRDAKKTDCPGQYMNIAAVRHMAAAMAGVTFPSGQTLASGEWVHDQSRR
jgi:N-acetyl-anhydromuramyl-L-alanine amidase AmpD